MKNQEIYIGLMSGTSLDGVDALLASFDQYGAMQIIDSSSLPYSSELRTNILSLQDIAENELHRAAKLANKLAHIYSEVVKKLLAKTNVTAKDICAIACHGQTIRHSPSEGYSYQIGNLAKLAELTGIDVIGDFRSRDIAANGQGAPLVPAFHHYRFSDKKEARAIVNIGGIANITALIPEQPVFGFDTGPGNILMDAWIWRHKNISYDKNGDWAAQGKIQHELLGVLLDDPYFKLAPPKSSGRDLFNLDWLAKHLSKFPTINQAVDVQTTLLELSAQSIEHAITDYLPHISSLYICGGGANNLQLMLRIQKLMPNISVKTTSQLALPTQQVEAAAFAWLAYCFTHRISANLPEATGADGKRILGALYPA